MNRIITFCTVLFFSVCIQSGLQAQFKISAEFRPRTEFSHGYKSLAATDQKASLFTSQRTRLNFDYKGDKIVTKLVLQDTRTWGAQKQLVDNNFNNIVGSELDATSIHEAWAEAFFTEKLSLKVGRQEVIYDDHRIFGSVGWAQQARSHDMGILKYESAFKIHLGLAYNQNTDRTSNIYDGPDAYKAMQYVWFNSDFSDLNLSVLFLNNGKPFVEETDGAGNVTKESIKYSQTFGPRAIYKMGDIKLMGNFYYQFGKDAGNNEVSAFELAFDGTYKMDDNISFFAGYEILSGTAFDENSKNKSFSPLYGTNHKFNGFMDYFYVGNHANNVGLQDIHLGGKYSEGKWFVQAKALIFSSAAEIAADTKGYLGTEIDLWAGYKISDEINLGVGYSHMFASKSMELIKGGDRTEMQNWAYVMLTFKPTFLNIDKKE